VLDAIASIIIAAFYSPLHFLLPALVLFITGEETEIVRRRLIRQGPVDYAMSMLYPFFGIWRRRRLISAGGDRQPPQ
jgi:hypothetical protein